MTVLIFTSLAHKVYLNHAIATKLQHLNGMMREVKISSFVKQAVLEVFYVRTIAI